MVFIKGSRTVGVLAFRIALDAFDGSPLWPVASPLTNTSVKYFLCVSENLFLLAAAFKAQPIKGTELAEMFSLSRQILIQPGNFTYIPSSSLVAYIVIALSYRVMFLRAYLWRPQV